MSHSANQGDGDARDSEPREKLSQGKGNSQRSIAGFVFRKGSSMMSWYRRPRSLASECDSAKASAQGCDPRARSHSLEIGRAHSCKRRFPECRQWLQTKIPL